MTPYISVQEQIIENPNTCKQGYAPSHVTNTLHQTITAFGYVYSHSTPVIMNGELIIHHTYKQGEHCVGVWNRGLYHLTEWDTCTSTASGRRTYGQGEVALLRHLRHKRSRYPELRKHPKAF